MPAGIEQTQNAIAPGSTPYGERGNLESAISQVSGSSPTPPAAPSSAGVGTGQNLDPLGALLGGMRDPGSSPVTDGLSVGPGDGPPAPPQISQRHQELLNVAVNARDPQLRLMARTAIRRLHARGEL